MDYFIINPGTGPVGYALCKEAWKNIRAFRCDLGLTSPVVTIERRADSDDGEGRYGFVLRRGARRSVEIQMPGVALDRVRSVVGLIPRLYVDGSSWLWPFALECVQELFDHDDRV